MLFQLCPPESPQDVLGQQDKKTVMKQLKEVAVKKQNIAVKLSGIKQDQGGGPVEGKALAVA